MMLDNFRNYQTIMQGVGIEPTRIATRDLKSLALTTRPSLLAITSFDNTHFVIFNPKKILFLLLGYLIFVLYIQYSIIVTF